MEKRILLSLLKRVPVLLMAGIFCLSARGEDASELLKLSGVNGGLVVHLGCGEGELTAALRVDDQFFVHGLDQDSAQVAATRSALIKQGVYGPVSVDQWDGKKLPYADNLISLIVAEKPGEVDEKELLRALAPRGVALILRGAKWEKIVKPWPKEMDEWTHYFHGPDGNPVGRDTAVAPPERLQWVGSPRWARHHDHMASMTSLVSAQGRLFYILDEGPTASIHLASRWRLVARDAFNGVILWKRDIDEWNTSDYPLKSGPAHLLRRLVAVGDRVFVTLGIDAPVVALDAATGKTVRTFEGSDFSREIVVSEGVAFFVADTSRSLLPDWQRKDTYVWANSNKANRALGWKGTPRKVFAYDADSGKRLWQADAPVAPCSMAVGAGRVVFHDGKKLICLDRKSGAPVWEGEAAGTALPVLTNTGPRVLIYQDAVLLAGNNGKMSGWAIKDGKKLWEDKHYPSGHQSLKDLFVVQGLAWSGAVAGSSDSGTFTGYNPLTGKVERKFEADVDVHWFHHRCYPAKATGKYLLMARNGTEFIDLETEHWKPHHWVRGGCIYGVMPCNGMLYASMHSCGCQLEAKLVGFNALAPGPLPKFTKRSLSSRARLERGPAYGKAEGPEPSPTDWPTFRHDAARSGASSADVSTGLKTAWKTKLGGRLTAPIVAAGKLFVASIDTHTLHALDAKSGRPLWTYTVGGRIDSPPTYYKGLALFGSADGYVYAVRAADGALAWRFRGAPVDRRIMAWEQVESAWPVHGNVLVQGDVLYCTAGRNMYLEGGIRFLRLDPATGRLLGETVMDDKDPDTGEDMHTAYLKKTQGNNMPVAHSDVLSSDGRNIWMRSQKIDFEGKRSEIALKGVKEQDPEGFHLFCQNGFLDDTFFFRSYWTYGRRVTGGYGGWYQAGRLLPSGRLLCFDDDRVYGYGRKSEYMVNSSVIEYQVFAADKTVTEEAIAQVAKVEQAMNRRTKERNGSSSDWLLRHLYPQEGQTAAQYQWIVDQPSMIARAMTVAGDTLFMAGPPDVIDERQAYRQPDNPEVKAALALQERALEGREGGRLWAFTKTDGKLAARYALDTIPVFDGMVAAGDSLYVATVDGRVLRLAGTGGAPLKKADDEPTRIGWDQPEDPGYLLPPVVLKDSDFAKVARCQVEESKLGYRLRAKGKKQPIGFAVKKLDRPITGTVTFKTRMKAVANAGALLQNGYLAFGDGMIEAKLIKCGARLRNQEAAIIQGPYREREVKAKNTKIDAPDAKGLDMEVMVDLKAQKITFIANGVTLKASIATPMKRITHVGYVMDNALIDFTPIEIDASR